MEGGVSADVFEAFIDVHLCIPVVLVKHFEGI